MTGIELVLFATLLGWITEPEPTPYPCYEQVDNKFIPYVCGEDE